ncbi:hypothetical protein HYV43_06230 [Candidatus Micrarchaeota archaeon]|nr:hypothetical protein [Candidatus Micrarchaeota archaeon]
MGFFDWAYSAKDETLWLLGLLVATFVFLGMGSAGWGTGASFNAWGAFLEVFKVVIGIQLVFGFIALLLSLLPLVVVVLIGLLGAYLFNRLVGSVSLTEGMAALTGGTSLQSIVVFALIVLLLL